MLTKGVYIRDFMVCPILFAVYIRINYLKRPIYLFGRTISQFFSDHKCVTPFTDYLEILSQEWQRAVRSLISMAA